MMDDNEQQMGLSEEGPVVSRETPTPEESRSKLVKTWQARVEADKKHWAKDFQRMREDMAFVYGKQWPDRPDDLSDDEAEYIANIAQRHINAKVAALYAKNPQATARVRDRMLSTVWDGDVRSVDDAVMALEMNPADQNAMMLLEDYQQTEQRRQLLERLARTLEIVYGYYVDEQIVPFKRQMKALVRRVVSCGVGYVKLGFQRVMERRPEIDQQIADMSARLSLIERIAADMADGEVEEGSAEAEELRLALRALENEVEVIVREGLLFDFPPATSIIPHKACRRISGFIGCDWVTQEYLLDPDQVQEVYGVDVGRDYQSYTTDALGKPYIKDTNVGPVIAGGDEDKDDAGKVCVWEIYSRRDQLVYVIADGYPDFLKEPDSPSVSLERFWPWFTLVFNEQEHDEHVFPLSDARLIRPMQLEYNRAREGLRQHRIAARPMTVYPDGMLDDEDKTKLEQRPPHAVVGIRGIQVGQNVAELLQSFSGPGIDPNLYETGPVFEDIQRVLGTQEAILGGTSGATATEASISEGARSSSLESNRDDLDDLLTEIARAAGQVLLSEVGPETVKRIAGPGAEWPELSRQEIVEEIFLEVQAGSTGRPNKAQELQNMERAMPFLIQIPGIDPEALAKEALRRMDDRLNLNDFLRPGIPSITSMNAAKQPGTGDPATDPNQQGGQGGNNAPQPPGNDAGNAAPPPPSEIENRIGR